MEATTNWIEISTLVQAQGNGALLARRTRIGCDTSYNYLGLLFLVGEVCWSSQVTPANLSAKEQHLAAYDLGTPQFQKHLPLGNGLSTTDLIMRHLH